MEHEVVCSIFIREALDYIVQVKGGSRCMLVLHASRISDSLVLCFQDSICR